MSDFDSSLPVRTSQPGDVASKIVDALVPSQGMTVNPDGSINTVVTATDLDIRDLSHLQDSIKVGDGTDFLAINADGSMNVTDNGGSLTVDSVDLDIRDLVFATDKVDVSGSVVALDAPTLAALESITVQNGPGAAAVNIQDGGNSITVDATDLDVRDLSHLQDSVKVGDGTDFLAIEADGAIAVNIRDAAGVAFGAMNPLPVAITLDNTGDEINDFLENANVAAAATATHSYTVTAGKTLILTQVEASASGKMRMELQVETGAGTGIFNTKFVQFNSTAEPNTTLKLAAPIKVVAGAIVKVLVQNRDLLPQSIYSTLSGQEV